MASPLVQVVAALLRMKKRDMAISLIDTFAETASTHEQYDEIAFLYMECKGYVQSVSFLKKCLASTADGQALYNIRANLAKVLNHMNTPEESLLYSQMNLRVIPDDMDSELEIGFSYYLLGQYDTSKSLMLDLRRRYNVTPAIRNRIQYNLATYKLEDGEFIHGLHDLVTIGHKMNLVPIRKLPEIPLWTGLPEKGKTLVILAEGGLGDELIGIRFMRHITELGMYPIWVTNHPQLVDVFNRHGYTCTTDITTLDISMALYCQAFYLPVHLGLTETELWNGPYLTPNSTYIAKWKSILPPNKKIAIKWFGNAEYEQDLHRSIPEKHIYTLRNHGTLISVQLEGCNEHYATDVGRDITHVEDTLAILSLCDTTVTSCTSVAHMIVAMGLNGIVCPPIVTYYCWLGRTDNKSNWYGDNLHVIRQTTHNDWTDVFAQVHSLLTE